MLYFKIGLFQFAIVNTVHTTIVDSFPQIFHKGRRPSYLMVVLCIVCFLFGLSCCCQVIYYCVFFVYVSSILFLFVPPLQAIGDQRIWQRLSIHLFFHLSICKLKQLVSAIWHKGASCNSLHLL